LRVHRFYKLLYIAALFSLLLPFIPVRADERVSSETARLLPDRTGEFQARGAAIQSKTDELQAVVSMEEFGFRSIFDFDQ